jgi:cytidylate kinase
MNVLEQRIDKALRARHPVLFLHSHEEDRVMQSLESIANDQTGLFCWTCTQGLDGSDDVGTTNPVVAIQEIIRNPRPGFFVFKDLTPFMDDPALLRVLRDAYHALHKIRGTHLFILSPVLVIPESLSKNIFTVDIPPPDTAELIDLANKVIPEYTQQAIPDKLLRDIALSLKGITLYEAEHVLHGVLSEANLTRANLLGEIRQTKKTIAASAGYLEYVPNDKELDQVGGLSNLKTWIMERASIFNQRAIDDGLPVPRGILIMGVSGCGKSLCAKVVASMWEVPLFRLDMNLIFSDIYGNPEAAFHKSLRAIESLAPAVLWIDEIENGLGFTERTNSIQSHIFSAFLTWMQEKPPLVFVAATANHIEILPAEMIRKGRFDQVFFVDLPDDAEREELFRIHLKLNNVDPDNFNMNSLILETNGWNGAEIEQVVNAARIHAHRENRAFDTRDIVDHSRMIVPLSRTMKEQIKVLKDWAWDRATPASQGKGTDFSILESSKIP